MNNPERAGLTQVQQKALDLLVDSHGFLLGEFELKRHQSAPDTPLSPFKISIREEDVLPGTYHPLVDAWAEMIYESTKDVVPKISHVVGAPNVGTALANSYSRLSGLNVLTMVKEGVGTTRRITNQIEGQFDRGDLVLALDDVISEGDSMKEMLNGILANGLRVYHIGVGWDRKQGGMDYFKGQGYSISASVDTDSGTGYYLEKSDISKIQFRRIKAYTEWFKTT